VSKQTRVNLLQSFIAVVVGNVVYFLLMPHLPPPARHRLGKMDLGVVIDFWICLVFWGAIKTLARRKQTSGQEGEQKR